jgi:hypothetical protein
MLKNPDHQGLWRKVMMIFYLVKQFLWRKHGCEVGRPYNYSLMGKKQIPLESYIMKQ